MSLTEAQIAFRKHGIGGSDANVVMSGDDEKIMRLWAQKRGDAPPEDLSDVLPVVIGSVTEPVNVAFFERRTGRKITNMGGERFSMTFPWMMCSLDGLTDGGETVFEAKTVSPFAKPEEIKARYMPQLTHNMLVCEVHRAVLSVIYGNGHRFEQYDVTMDEEYAECLIRAEELFWNAVQTGQSPVFIEPPPPPVEAIRIVDMGESNEWGSAAGEWLENLAASKKFTKAADTIKGLIESDVVEAFGHGITAKRSKTGAVTIRGMK